MIGALTAVTYEPRDWTSGDVAFITTLATHAAIALTNAELFEQTEARAAQLAVLQAASARMSRAGTVEEIGRTVVEETRRIIDYHNARVYLIEPPDEVVPIAFEGIVGAYEQVDLELLRCQLGEGFTGWVALHGEPLLVNDANADPRGATIAGTDDVDESMLVVPMRYDQTIVGVITLSKLGLDQFGADDLRLLTILADQAATAVESARLLARTAGPRRRAAPPARHERRAVRQPRPAPGREPHRRPPGPGDGRRRVRDQLLGPAGRPGRVARLLPRGQDRRDGAVLRRRRAIPRRCACSSARTRVIIDADDPAADPAEVALLRRDGNRVLAMLPLVAKGQSIGLVELFSTLGRSPGTTSASQLGPDDGQRGGDGARERAALRGRAQPRRPRPADRLLQPPVPARAARRGGRPGPARAAAAERADARPRRLQARQRHVRPPVRRPGPDLDRRAHPLDPARRRTSRRATAATSSRSSCPRPTPTRPGRRPSGSSRRSATTPFVGRAARAGADRRVDRRGDVPADGRTATELIAAADRALYQRQARAAATTPRPRRTPPPRTNVLARKRPGVPAPGMDATAPDRHPPIRRDANPPGRRHSATD